MKRLPYNYEEEKYGLKVRLVQEEDADFIVKLRTSPKASNFLHYTDCDINKQKEWIKEYKTREMEGKEYYFVFIKNNQKQGLIRLYNINGKQFTVVGVFRMRLLWNGR